MAQRFMALALAAQALTAMAKVQVLRVTLGGEVEEERVQWQYLEKFGFGLGTSTYRVRVREVYPKLLPEGTPLELEPFLDEQWPAAELEEDSCSRSRFAKKPKTLRLGGDGEWGEWKQASVSQSIRSHMWYFALSDCSTGSLTNGTYTFEVELEAQQAGGSHFSVESMFAPHFRVAFLLGCTAFLLSLHRRMCAFVARMDSLHPVIWVLAGVVVAQYLAQLLHIGHLAMYWRDGQGSLMLEILAEALFTSSQVAQASLLILIAMGYTLTRSKLGDLAGVLPVCGAVASVHALLVVLDHMQEEASSTFTKHEGMKGWSFLALRLALYVWFCYSARQTASVVGLKLRAFLCQFQLAASLYFLAYPVLFVLVPIFAPYLRKPVLDFGLMAAQVCSNVWLASLFLGRGAYFDASSLSASLLPGGSLRYFKED